MVELHLTNIRGRRTRPPGPDCSRFGSFFFVLCVAAVSAPGRTEEAPFLTLHLCIAVSLPGAICWPLRLAINIAVSVASVSRALGSEPILCNIIHIALHCTLGAKFTGVRWQLNGWTSFKGWLQAVVQSSRDDWNMLPCHKCTLRCFIFGHYWTWRHTGIELVGQLFLWLVRFAVLLAFGCCWCDSVSLLMLWLMFSHRWLNILASGGNFICLHSGLTVSFQLNRE